MLAQEGLHRMGVSDGGAAMLWASFVDAAGGVWSSVAWVVFVFKLFARKDQGLLIWVDDFLILDLGLHVGPTGILAFRSRRRDDQPGQPGMGGSGRRPGARPHARQPALGPPLR